MRRARACESEVPPVFGMWMKTKLNVVLMIDIAPRRPFLRHPLPAAYPRRAPLAQPGRAGAEGQTAERLDRISPSLTVAMIPPETTHPVKNGAARSRVVGASRRKGQVAREPRPGMRLPAAGFAAVTSFQAGGYP